MKVARVFGVLFGILGLVLMLGTAALCFGSLDAPARAEVPREVKDCAAEVAELLNRSDLDALAEKFYGEPRLGTDRALVGDTAAVWEIFCEGISCELTSDIYVVGSSYAVDAVITVPKIESITDSVTEHGKRLLDERVAAAEKMAELYDENGEFRKDLIDEVMVQAVALSLGEEPEMLTCETTVSFVYKAERWQAVPDQTLMRALQGGLN